MTPMLGVACLVLVQVLALRLALAWSLLVVLGLVVALKEERLIQQQAIHVLVVKYWCPCPFHPEAYRARPSSVEQLADVVVLCPNTRPLQTSTFPKVGVYHECGLGEVPPLHHSETEAEIDLPDRLEMLSWHTTFPKVQCQHYTCQPCCRRILHPRLRVQGKVGYRRMYPIYLFHAWPHQHRIVSLDRRPST